MILCETNISERTLSEKLGISRSTLRKAKQCGQSVKLSTFQRIANYFERQVELISYPKDHQPDCTSLATGFRIERDGFSSWKIHLMNMVDEFRRTKDERLILLPPEPSCHPKIKALIASTVLELCQEVNLKAPNWAKKTKALEQPWFLAEIESLKASAILESSFGFRSKNIFVLSNFLDRA